MRRSAWVAAFFSVLFAISSAEAARGGGGLSGSERIWGRAACGRRVACSGLMALTPDMPQFISLLGMATQCVTTEFGYSNGDNPVFNASRGIDGSRCFKTEKSEQNLVPLCCFREVSGADDSCELFCQLKER